MSKPIIVIVGEEDTPVPKQRIIGTLRDLCKNTPVLEIVEEARKFCQMFKPEEGDDISLDIAAAAKFLAQSLLNQNVDDGDAIDIPFIGGMRWVQNGEYVLYNKKVEDIFSVIDFKISADGHITDCQALVCVIWTLTMRGWPDGLAEWIGIKEGELPQSTEKYHLLLKGKLGI